MKKLATAKKPVKKVPLWDLYRDGVTFSLLSKFIICRHRFWIRTVLGLREDLGFNHRIEYGSILHAGFEAYAEHGKSLVKGLAGIKAYTDHLKNEHSQDSEEIAYWHRFAVGQFKQYVKHWTKEDTKKQYIAQEATFDAPVTLPSGRKIRLRGKIDEVFKTPGRKGTGKCLHLQENKSKGDINESALMQQLQLDLQTMMYLYVLNYTDSGKEIVKGQPVNHLLYNLIQRPLGGKWSPRQKRTENKNQFADRVLEQMSTEPNRYFLRLPAEFDPPEIPRFANRTLLPILEQLSDWWDSIKANPFDPWTTTEIFSHPTHSPVSDDMVTKKTTRPNHLHYARPFGVYDSLALGYEGDYYQFIISGGVNKIGLKKLDTVFPELDNASLSNR